MTRVFSVEHIWMACGPNLIETLVSLIFYFNKYCDFLTFGMIFNCFTLRVTSREIDQLKKSSFKTSFYRVLDHFFLESLYLVIVMVS